jgi:hypothetical protein
MYSGEYDACDVTLSVYPHRASLKNMPDHGGNRTYDHAVEGFLQCIFNHSTDLKCICRPCYNNIKKGQSILQENVKQMESCKLKAGETLMRTRVKRGLASPATEMSDCHQEKTSTKTR